MIFSKMDRKELSTFIKAKRDSASELRRVVETLRLFFSVRHSHLKMWQNRGDRLRLRAQPRRGRRCRDLHPAQKQLRGRERRASGALQRERLSIKRDPHTPSAHSLTESAGLELRRQHGGRVRRHLGLCEPRLDFASIQPSETVRHRLIGRETEYVSRLSLSLSLSCIRSSRAKDDARRSASSPRTCVWPEAFQKTCGKPKERPSDTLSLSLSLSKCFFF